MTKAQARIQVRVDQDVKEQSEEILGKIGISMSDLINMTLRRVIYERRIPFDTAVENGADNLDLKIDYNDPNLPECMRIRTEEELIEHLQKATECNLEHPETYTIDEMKQQLNKRYGLQV